MFREYISTHVQTKRMMMTIVVA